MFRHLFVYSVVSSSVFVGTAPNRPKYFGVFAPEEALLHTLAQCSITCSREALFDVEMSMVPPWMSILWSSGVVADSIPLRFRGPPSPSCPWTPSWLASRSPYICVFSHWSGLPPGSPCKGLGTAYGLPCPLDSARHRTGSVGKLPSLARLYSLSRLVLTFSWLVLVLGWVAWLGLIA